MAILSGVWVWNDAITASGFTSATLKAQTVNFTSAGKNWTGFSFSYESTTPSAVNYKASSGFTGVYNISDGKWYVTDEGYRTMDFGTEDQEVSDNFYNWLTANAVQKDVIKLSPCKLAVNLLPTGSGSRFALVKK